ncbi:MAG: 2-amino-4-hydroxy-6-hydroxymethyldihydropteridine diphosphokinase [Candidatus Polarisedimenticolaceae bacterium]|nr:2-amino-4-hydroxy-6-hydroxymethyldihydropteridine diphosphokinase [Candidatus Polarisedimenticolaceae bacterium]
MNSVENARVFIGLGSNLEAPRQQLTRAIEQLAELAESGHLKVSSFYRSRPLGPQNQPDYINAVAGLTTQLSPEILLDRLQAIEQAHGRRRDGPRWGARTLDLDLLLYADRIICSERLTVPHPGLPERAFVLIPLADIAEADLMIPGIGTLQQLLSAVDGDDLERLDE